MGLMPKSEKGNNSVKVNQVIYIKYPNCMPDITILAQEVLRLFCSQACFTTQNDKVGKGR